jgi:Flavodoxin
VRALVVYESMYGNTAEIAQAVMKGLLGSVAAELVEVSDAPSPLPDEVDLLVVGGPTHGFGMSRPGTRDTARKQAGESLVSRGRGIREWLAGLPPARRDVVSATFDTRFDKPRWLTGSAARGATRLLRQRGYRPVIEPTSFHVTTTAGPLADGERVRATQWGRMVGTVALTSIRQTS